MVDHRGDIAGGEYVRVGDRLQGVVDADEAIAVELQPAVAQPGGATGAGDPHHFIGIETGAAVGGQAADAECAHFGITVHLHATLAEHPFERGAHPGVVGRQDRPAAGEQMELEIAWRAPECAQFVVQPELHRQQQLDPAGAAADHRDARLAGMPAHPRKQGQPALVELENRLHRHRMQGRAGHRAELRGGTDVDRQQVVGHRRAPRQQHLLRAAVEPGHLATVEACAGELRETAQIDVHLVEAVVAGDIARQHARIRRVGIAADHGQTHAGHRAHAEVADHADMAVAAAYQYDIAQNGLIRCLHRGSGLLQELREIRRQAGV